jgi:hypothetical protein
MNATPGDLLAALRGLRTAVEEVELLVIEE